ncbi:Fe-S protein assembly co-chaperone HscB protein [Toxoplasma gondii ARI]|uniref:Fe-S protein assembly co-chaperone HscB protein n=1 Tax=Toxoplasma gondii ARI TaxID=1074872 RepID=A0A139Y2S1_TOXGO|nr:Fe-S protein assembly co-chaperone HscB protein [Toxoplasma gondii ARI]
MSFPGFIMASSSSLRSDVLLKQCLAGAILRPMGHPVPCCAAGTAAPCVSFRTQRRSKPNGENRSLPSQAPEAIVGAHRSTRGGHRACSLRTLRSAVDSESTRNVSFLSESASCAASMRSHAQSLVSGWPRRGGLRFSGCLPDLATGSVAKTDAETRTTNCRRRTHLNCTAGASCRSRCSWLSIRATLPLLGEYGADSEGRIFSSARRASFWMQSLGFGVVGQREFSEATGGKTSREATALSPASDNLREKLSQAGLVHSTSCTNCKAAPARKYQIFCSNCGDALVPQYGDANKRDFSYFEFLQMNPTFDIDRAALEAKYKQLEKRLHPDKHVHADQEYHDRLAKHRTKVIEAVSALKNPAKRALHLLAHHSPHSSEHVEDEPDADRVTDGDLLQEVFELNEALEMVTSREELDEFKRRVDALLEKDERDLSRRFREKDFDGIRSVIHRYQMHAKLQESIKDWSSPA